ncbi:DNA-directed RNA polymerase III subunit RPC3 [Gigaspora margarita]|uniref:DNA-directed RNA polymerase III subunit RPC3 n=1 Tax=Gigaspora margarita TaxID=4874 RepID=A0A8H3ZZY6_GIGMA|nr:DNA-directed RNA polymerase III subunit RPC3 [Gigaspora margarita]
MQLIGQSQGFVCIIKYILDIADCGKASEIESCSIPEIKDEMFAQQMKTEKGKTVFSHESLIKQYLNFLIEDDANILCKKDENMDGMFFISYNALCESLKQQIFENIILEKYGIKGQRILKITAFTLMSVTNVRQKLYQDQEIEHLQVPSSFGMSTTTNVMKQLSKTITVLLQIIIKSDKGSCTQTIEFIQY